MVDKVPIFAHSRGCSKRRRGEIPDRPLKQGQVWEYLKKAFLAKYPQGHIIRIEDQVGRGIPDVYYCMSDRAGWIEIKTSYQKPTALQKAWHSREREAGGSVCVLTVRPDKCIIDFGDGQEDLGIATWAMILYKL